MTHITRTKSSRDDWGTPQYIFDMLNEEFKFTVDVCADEYNYKCERYYTVEDDGLSKSWEGERVFCNPPYSEKDKWMEKASIESYKANTIVLIIPDATDTKAWHKYVMNDADEIRFAIPRIQFEDRSGNNRVSNTRGSAIVIWNYRACDGLCETLCSSFRHK